MMFIGGQTVFWKNGRKHIFKFFSINYGFVLSDFEKKMQEAIKAVQNKPKMREEEFFKRGYSWVLEKKKISFNEFKLEAHVPKEFIRFKKSLAQQKKEAIDLIKKGARRKELDEKGYSYVIKKIGFGNLQREVGIPEEFIKKPQGHWKKLENAIKTIKAKGIPMDDITSRKLSEKKEYMLMQAIKQYYGGYGRFRKIIYFDSELLPVYPFLEKFPPPHKEDFTIGNSPKESALDLMKNYIDDMARQIEREDRTKISEEQKYKATTYFFKERKRPTTYSLRNYLFPIAQKQ